MNQIPGILKTNETEDKAKAQSCRKEDGPEEPERGSVDSFQKWDRDLGSEEVQINRVNQM